MDFTDIRKLSVDYFTSIDSTLDFDGEFIFYYDETNNVRVLRLKNGKLNIDKNRDFILGGIVLSKSQNIDDANFQHLKNTLKVKDEELKIAQLGLRNADFLKCLQSKKMRDFLNWLKCNDISVHFKVLDNLFYALADIIDDINLVPSEYRNDLKTILYAFAYENTDDFLLLLEKHNYPDINPMNYTAFYNDIILFISKCNIPKSLQHIPATKDVLLFFLNNTKTMPSSFLFNNKQNELINEYAQLYSQNIFLLNRSFHYFDEEQQVQEKIGTISLFNKPLTNFEFLSSKNHWQIQISDIIVGLLGKLFEYIKPLTLGEVLLIPKNLNPHQQATFELLTHLLINSYKKSSVFRNTSSNYELNLKFDQLFGYNFFTLQK